MRRIATKTAAMFGVVLVLFTMFAALPVYADDYILEDWLTGWSGQLFWGAMDQLYKYVDYTTYGPSKDDVVVYRSPSGGGGGFSGGGGFGGGGGRNHDVLTQPRDYYTNTTIKTYEQKSNKYLNIDKQTYNVYNSSTTKNYSTINYERGGDTYNITVDNSQTINNTYNITEIYYNIDYDVYNVYTTNSYNYYLTYSPTFMTVTYLEPGKGEAVTNVYFYQLPDGRNSWDLTRDEAFGMYYLYNATNYETVVEDSKTKGLFHLDGTMADESTYNATATYTKGGSHNYVEHGGYDRALYWGPDNEQALQFKTGGGGTMEFMLYTAVPTVLPQLKQTRYSYSVPGYIDDPGHMIPYERSKQKLVGPSHYLADGYRLYAYTSGDIVWNSRDYPFWQNYSITTWSVEKEIGALVSSGGSSVIPLYLYGDVQVTSESKMYWEHKDADTSTSPVKPPFWWQKREDVTEIASPVRGDIGVKVAANNSRGWEFRKLPTGSWNHIAVSGGAVYVNGLKWDVVGATGVGGTFTIGKPAEWNNYWYLDEVRMSAGALYTATYTPQGHPFDTNKVLVLPDEGKHGDIAVKSNIPVKTMRVGGARPTYPAVGDVFISVEKSTADGKTKHLVKSVQQYQAGGWLPVDASIRVYAEWVHLKDYDLKAFTLDELPKPNDATLQKFEGSIVRFKGPADAIQKVIVHGKTYEIGTGPRGLDNPYSVYGIQNPVIKVNGTSHTMATNGELFKGDTRSSQGAESHAHTDPPSPGGDGLKNWWDKVKDTIKHLIGDDDPGTGEPGGDDDGDWWDGLLDGLGDGLLGLLGKLLAGAVKILGLLVDGLIKIVGLLFDGLGELLSFTERFGAFIGAAFVFIPPEITTVLVVGLVLAVILMIINFFR